MISAPVYLKAERRKLELGCDLQQILFSKKDMGHIFVDAIAKTLIPIYDENRIAHRKQAHYSTKYAVEQALLYFSNNTEFIFNVQKYCDRSKYTRRKRKKLFVGDFLPKFKFILTTNYGSVFATFTTDDILKYRNKK